MRTRTFHPRWLGRTARLLLAALLLNCTTWRAQTAPPPQDALPHGKVREARVWLADSTVARLGAAYVAGDTLWGVPGSRGRSDALPATVASPEPPIGISLSEVRRIEVRKTDPVKTALLIVGVGAAVALAIGAIAYAADPCTPWCSSR